MPIAKGNIITLLTSMRDKLTDDGVFTTDECYISLEDHIEFGPGGLYCLITPRPFRSYQPGVAGGSTEVTIVEGDVVLTLWSHYAADEAARDTEALTNTTLGVYTKIDDILDSLHMYLYCDGTDGKYAVPIRLDFIDTPKRSKDNPDWLYVMVVFKCQVWLNVS